MLSDRINLLNTRLHYTYATYGTCRCKSRFKLIHIDRFRVIRSFFSQTTSSRDFDRANIIRLLPPTCSKSALSHGLCLLQYPVILSLVKVFLPCLKLPAVILTVSDLYLHHYRPKTPAAYPNSSKWRLQRPFRSRVPPFLTSLCFPLPCFQSPHTGQGYCQRPDLLSRVGNPSLSHPLFDFRFSAK